MDKYYTKLNHVLSDEFVSSAIAYAETIETWEQRFYFDRTTLPDSVIQLDPLVSQIITHYKSRPRASIFRFTPYTACNWHIDQPRNCAVNMLLTGFNSLCAFGQQEGSTPIIYRNVAKLDYQRNAMYAFNTEMAHSITNFEETRYLISLGIPPPATYNDLVEYLKLSGYIDEK